MEQIWDRIQVVWANPALSFAFMQSCVEAYGLADRLAVLVSPNQGAMIAPLCRSKTSSRLELIGQNQIFEASDFLYGANEDISGLARAVVALGLPLRLTRLPADSATIPALENAYRGRGLVVKRPASGCPWIDLDETWKQPDQHLNSGRRSDLRRARRNAEKIGVVSFDICTPKPAELEGLLEEVYAVESAGWKAREGSAMAADHRMGSFYRSFAEAACRKQTLRLAFMRIDGKAVAAQLAVQANDAYWLLKIGYSEEFKRCSPGILLVLETIRHAADAGLRFYEFLGTEEEWIKLWKPHLRSCVRLQTYPFNFHGLRALTHDAFIALRADLRRLSSKIRRNQ